jgi:uncharacterized membrane protein YsdA (DUF1294 family)
MLELAKIIIAYFMLINAITYLLFYLDKKAAIANRRRIPEKTLLLAAFLGGSPLAIVAMNHLRHKTVKQPFKNILIGIIALQGILILAGLFFAAQSI